jgi:coproporphyrinogen III oxidase-like Fe-S oxidoreductase
MMDSSYDGPMMDGSPYQGYLYAYPHKTAYRPLRPRPVLRDIWATERRDALSLYLHVPFCEARCGFCNLFTRANPAADVVSSYLRQLRHQAECVDEALAATGPSRRFATRAVGGGTPTYLNADELDTLFDIMAILSGPGGGAPMSVETSPATASPERLAVLAERGVTRVSLGVQSFLDSEVHAVGRPQRRSDVDRALAEIRACGVPALNIDLIYGIDGQTPATWAESLRVALEWQPEEIYLYPLYLRPYTGLGQRETRLNTSHDPQWDAQRMTLYRHGRDVLREAGYRQMSMRQFRLEGAALPAGDYCCQNDGMVGLGCGARSYTRCLHYSFDYAVSIPGVRAVIDDYLMRDPAEFAAADVGFVLDEPEQRRRWLVTSLLRADGADLTAYQDRFGTSLVDDYPQLSLLRSRGWLGQSDAHLALTDDGLAHSDAIGPWLISEPVRSAMQAYALR